MRLEPTDMQGLALLHWDVSADARGDFARIFCAADLAAAGLDFSIAQANLSRNSASHTLRGLHFQAPPHGEPKIVACTRGRVWDVAVDLRRGSPTYARWRGIMLSPGCNVAVHIPTGFAHGFLTLEPACEVLYLMDAPYVPEAAMGLRWDDPAVGIEWPAAPAVISPRDRALPQLAQLSPP